MLPMYWRILRQEPLLSPALSPTLPQPQEKQETKKKEGTMLNFKPYDCSICYRKKNSCVLYWNNVYAMHHEYGMEPNQIISAYSFERIWCDDDHENELPTRDGREKYLIKFLFFQSSRRISSISSEEEVSSNWIEEETTPVVFPIFCCKDTRKLWAVLVVVAWCSSGPLVWWYWSWSFRII